VQIRRLLVALASGGTGLLMLCALGYAMGHQQAHDGAALRLAWCVVPLAVTADLAAAVARTDPGTRPRPGVFAAGLGPGRLMMISVLTTAVTCLLGSVLALLCFLQLRGNLVGPPFGGTADELLAADRPLPVAALLMLLGTVPLTACAATAVALRPGRAPDPAGVLDDTGPDGTPAFLTASAPLVLSSPSPGSSSSPSLAPSPASSPSLAPSPASSPSLTASASLTPSASPAASVPAVSRSLPAPLTREALPVGALSPARELPSAGARPGGLPWGIALLALGVAVQAHTAPADRVTSGPPLPGAGADGSLGALGGWVLTAFGLALAGPAVAFACGWLLQIGQPGGLRLLAGRILQQEAWRVGRPLGVLCAVASSMFTAGTLAAQDEPGAVPLLGGLVVAGCTLTTLLMGVAQARQARARTTALLLRLGAPASLLRTAAAVRTGTLLAVFTPLAWGVAQLVALPAGG
jgi:hypothetical protein